MTNNIKELSTSKLAAKLVGISRSNDPFNNAETSNAFKNPNLAAAIEELIGTDKLDKVLFTFVCKSTDDTQKEALFFNFLESNPDLSAKLINANATPIEEYETDVQLLGNIFKDEKLLKNLSEEGLYNLKSLIQHCSFCHAEMGYGVALKQEATEKWLTLHPEYQLDEAGEFTVTDITSQKEASLARS